MVVRVSNVESPDRSIAWLRSSFNQIIHAPPMKRGQWNCDKAEIVSSRARTGLKWEKQRDREEVNGDGVWWSGRQQISPDDFHFQRTNYSPSPRARSFVSAAFANKSASRNGCAATKSRPNPDLVKCPGPTAAIGWFWASRKSSTTPHPLFFELSLFSKVLFTGKCCEKRFLLGYFLVPGGLFELQEKRFDRQNVVPLCAGLLVYC